MQNDNISKIGLTLFILLVVVPIAIIIKYPQLHTMGSVESIASGFPIYYSDKAAILMYHSINDPETSATISTADFREQITTLQNKGYNFISLQQLGVFLAGKQDIPPNAVVITFDDGYSNVYQNAYPILTEFNLPASCFLIVKNVGAISNQIPKLTWGQIKEMQNHDITFYSHSYNSHHLVTRQDGTKGSELNSPMFLPDKKRYENCREYQPRIYNDLLLSKTTLEKELNTNVDFLALPYGYTNDTVVKLAQEIGYHYLLTVTPGLADKDSDKMRLPRINAGKIGMNGEQLHNLIISCLQP